MFTRENRQMLQVIYGDDLELLGDIVLVRNKDSDRVTLISQDGELLEEKPVIAVTRVLSTGGFHYVVITDREECGRSVSNKNMREKDLYGVFRSRNTIMVGIREEVDYTYKIFNSKFEPETAGKTRATKATYEKLSIDVFGKIFRFTIEEGRLEIPEYG